MTVIPTNSIDLIDKHLLHSGMGHPTPLVARRYADFGGQASAICHAR